MKKRLFKGILTGVFLAFTGIFFNGCTLFDDYSNCPPHYTITVRAYTTEGSQALDEKTVAEVALYVFDHNEKYLGMVNTRLNTPTSLDFPGHSDLHVVALGNSVGTNHSVQPSDGLDKSTLSLVRSTELTAEYNLPNDIFHGKKSFKIESKYIGQNIEIPGYRIVGRMNITVRGIDKQPRDTDSDYHIVVKETYSAMNFHGNMLGNVNKATSKPSSAFISNNDLFADNFNLFPNEPGTNIKIDIYYKGVPLVQNIEFDRDGKDIQITPNGQSNVFIVLGQGNTLVDLQIVPAKWGDRIPIWTER